VFAPCRRLGLIVVDEEQETSFKHLATPFYHARDVAIKRGQLDGIPVVLGSATPALETWDNALGREHFELVRLPERVPGAALPRTCLVEPASESGWDRDALISPTLAAQIRRTVADSGQVILLHNRRGYATTLRCRRCSLTVGCERCGGHLVYHQAEGVLKCHRCGARSEVIDRCRDASCGGEVRRSGLAIQRLEEELAARFPALRYLRLDSDTMRRRDDYERALTRFERGDADVLLGTQMVAKGLDFPRVRLVGVIDADAALSLPDFRAGERVFQLLVQVLGRAGRREGASLAVIQSSQAPASVLRDALALDYEGFAHRELASRKRYDYPPFARLVRCTCADRRPSRARAAAEKLAHDLAACAGRVHAALRVHDAEPCILTRVRGQTRYQVLLRGPRGNALQTLLRTARQARLLSPRADRFVIDVDPVDLL
jgi:primosomal protein N' (replication factor Y)